MSKNKGNMNQMQNPAGANIVMSGNVFVQPNAPGIKPVMTGPATSVPPVGPSGEIVGSGPSGIMINEEPADPLANIKEKTPMCLINELARYNKTKHVYMLEDEQGPAHKKNFYVKLQLGDEEYQAAGPSIKKAQHSAAAIALEKTGYKHPPPKPPKNYNTNLFPVSANNVTPTVELNALAMKRGEPAIYQGIEPNRQQPPPSYDYRGMYNQRYHCRMPRMFYVSLKVGPREFIGEGPTRQAARHCAADKALKVLRNLPMPNNVPQMPVVEDNEDSLKSEISLVYEIALKRKMTVKFEVTSESGPPHMRTFITRCIVGDYHTEGEGNGKKISKKRAAEKMLDQLNKLGPLPPSIPKPKPKTQIPYGAGTIEAINYIPVNKKKNRNLIKMQKASPDYGVGINPISRLIQIQQAKKEKEPIYTLIEERGEPRCREFVIQVAVGDHKAQGAGPSKKFAKRNAAEAMLQLLGYSRPTPQPNKPSIKTGNGTEGNSQVPDSNGKVQFMTGDKKVTFLDSDVTAGRQLVPGVLLMPDANRPHGQGMFLNRAPGAPLSMNEHMTPATTAMIARELLDKGISPTAEALQKAGTKQAHSQKTVRPKQKLLYLADVMGFQVQYTDFPKGNNKNEYLSLVTLSTNPPVVSHGAGLSVEASHDAAAMTALQSLADMGINTCETTKDKMAAGDGPHMEVKQEKKSPTGKNKAK